MTRRSERTSELIKREISRLLERKVNDPRLSELISVTEVTLSPDLKYAKVFVSILGNETNKKEVLEGFSAASGFLRRELASHLKLKYTPQLSFHYDDSIERGASLLKLMGQIGDNKQSQNKGSC
jgi:ribosome-binding factor A